MAGGLQEVFLEPRSPSTPSAALADIRELVIRAHAEVQTGLILILTSVTSPVSTFDFVHKNDETNVAVRRCKLSLIFRAASGRSDRYLPRCRERGWDESIPLGPCSFLINSGRCSTPRLLCIRCIPGSPYEVHLPHTHARIQPQRGTHGYHWSPADTGGALILLGGHLALTTAYPSSRRQIYIKSSSIPAGEGPCFLSSSRGEARRRGEAGTR